MSDTPVGADISAVAMVRPEQLPSLAIVRERAPLIVGRFDLALASPSVADAEVLLATLRTVEAGSDQANTTLGEPVLASRLVRVLADEESRRRLTDGALAVASALVAAVSIVAAAQLGRLAMTRHRGRLAVTRARGASWAQTMGAAVTEAAMVAVPAVAGGWQRSVCPTHPTEGTVAVVIVGLASVIAIAASAGVEARRPLGDAIRGVRPRVRPPWRRVGDVLVVVVAVIAGIALARRGIDLAAEQEVDVLVAAAPTLVAIAAGVVIRVMVPLIARFAAGLARRGRSLGVFVGLRRSSADPEVGASLVVVLVLAVATATFGLSVDRTITDGQVAASWARSTTPYLFDVPPLTEVDPDLLRRAPGVTDASFETRTTVQLRFEGDSALAVMVVVDAAPLDRILSSVPEAPTIAGAITGPAIGAGTGADTTLLVMASGRFSNEVALHPGAIVTGLIGGGPVRLEVVSTLPSFLGQDGLFVVVDRGQLEAVTGATPVVHRVYLDGEEVMTPTLRGLADQIGGRFFSQRVERADLAAQPLARSARLGFLAAAGVGLGMAVLAVVAILVVTAGVRRRQAGLLAAYGADRRQVRAAFLAELLPPAVVAITVGAFLGLTGAALLRGSPRPGALHRFRCGTHRRRCRPSDRCRGRLDGGRGAVDAGCVRDRASGPCCGRSAKPVLGPHRRAHAKEVVGPNRGRACRRRVEPTEDVEQRRLTRAGGPDHGDRLAGIDVRVATDGSQSPATSDCARKRWGVIPDGAQNGGCRSLRRRPA